MHGQGVRGAPCDAAGDLDPTDKCSSPTLFARPALPPRRFVLDGGGRYKDRALTTAVHEPVSALELEQIALEGSASEFAGATPLLANGEEGRHPFPIIGAADIAIARFVDSNKAMESTATLLKKVLHEFALSSDVDPTNNVLWRASHVLDRASTVPACCRFTLEALHNLLANAKDAAARLRLSAKLGVPRLVCNVLLSDAIVGNDIVAQECRRWGTALVAFLAQDKELLATTLAASEGDSFHKSEGGVAVVAACELVQGLGRTLRACGDTEVDCVTCEHAAWASLGMVRSGDARIERWVRQAGLVELVSNAADSFPFNARLVFAARKFEFEFGFPESDVSSQ